MVGLLAVKAARDLVKQAPKGGSSPNYKPWNPAELLRSVPQVAGFRRVPVQIKDLKKLICFLGAENDHILGVPGGWAAEGTA